MTHRVPGGGGRRLQGLAAILVLAAAGLAPALAASEDCLMCHSDESLTMERRGRELSLYVDEAGFSRSVHASLDCTDCHAGFDPEQMPHKARIEPINCMDCHSDAAETHPFHQKMSEATGTDGGPGRSCKQCHGTHDVQALDDPDSKWARSQLSKSCGKCHADIARHFEASEHGQALAAGAPGAPDCLRCHESPISPARQPDHPVELKITQEKICLSCHLDDPEVRAKMGPGAGFIEAYGSSVHGTALRNGNPDAATCVDCHGSHDMLHAFDPHAQINKTRIPGTCAKCHERIAEEYSSSIHAEALARGVTDAPVCTDCHGEHSILQPSDPRSPVAFANVSIQVCTPCHASVKLAAKYGIPSGRPRTFADSYHGLALRGGSVEAANCTSCHGAHAIKPSSDPTSSTSKQNLSKTCGKCHPGANQRFAVGQVHVDITEQEEPILYWIGSIYIILIVGTIGGMLFHNAADFVKKSRHRMKKRLGEIQEEPFGHERFERMSLNERLQHASLLVSFVVLVITGFMLHYPDAWWVAWLRGLGDDVFDLRSTLHRIAGVVMTIASLYHLGYITLTARGRRLVADLFPRARDVADAFQMLRYNLGLSRRRPAFGRFSYIEKSEYWALVWGTIVMVATGVIMWFENTFIGLFTKLGWDIARTVHFYEAWLATLAIIVWHIYYVIFNPDVYPMNTAWWTGKITEAEMMEEHPLQLAELRKKGKRSDEA